MKKQMRENLDEKGGLTCAICGRKGLKPFKTDKRNQATLDHIVEIVKGGKWNDYTNFQVACGECNARKNNNLQRIKNPIDKEVVLV